MSKSDHISRKELAVLLLCLLSGCYLLQQELNAAEVNTSTESFTLVGLLQDNRALIRPHDVELQGNGAYVPGKGGTLAIIDISDASKPRLLSFINGLEDAETVLPLGDILLLGTRDFLSVDVKDPRHPKIVNRISNRPSIDYLNGMARRGDYVFTANKSGYVTFFDISEPADPVLKGILDTRKQGKLRSPHDMHMILFTGMVNSM